MSPIATVAKSASGKNSALRVKKFRDATGWNDFQIRDPLARQADLEYVLVYRGCRGGQFVYELLYDIQGKQGEPLLMGLRDGHGSPP
jgi:hypothetical protein